jgi:hypothetical protein
MAHLLSWRRFLQGSALRRVALILTFAGGVTTTVSGSVIWLSYVLMGIGRGWLPPAFGFLGFLWGLLILLGGILIARGREVVGGNLVLWSGLASLLGGGVLSTGQTFAFLQIYGILAYGLMMTLAFVCPVLGGVLSLLSREANP